MKFPIDIDKLLVIRNVLIFGPNGSTSVDLIFDTGATYTMISYSVLKRIGYNPQPNYPSNFIKPYNKSLMLKYLRMYNPKLFSNRESIITADTIIDATRLKVDKIIVGDKEAKEVEVLCHDIPDVRVSGLLGLSFLKHFRTVIDYKQGYLEIS